MVSDLENKVGLKAIQMLCYALNGKKLDPDFFSDSDSEKVLNLCKRHKVSALASLALSDPDEEWTNARMESIRRTALFDKERDEICRFFEEQGIWYCPLKGVILKDLYPQYGVREMGDNDILVDDEKMMEIRSFMIDRGYTFKDYGYGPHDPYYKKPIYNFEIHRFLFNESSENNFNEYYRNVKNKLVNDRNSGYKYHFSDEDFYIYYIVHNHKHLSAGGSGLRTLTDIYVFLSKHKDMDRKYIESQLEILDLLKEETMLKNLSLKLFDEEMSELTTEEKELLNYILSSGVYGTVKNNAENKLNKLKEQGSHYKARYIYQRMFLEERSLKHRYPFFYKHAWARPFLLPIRGFRILFTDRKRFFNELKTVFEEGKKDD